MSTFQGLPPGLFEFFAELQADNSTAFGRPTSTATNTTFAYRCDHCSSSSPTSSSHCACSARTATFDSPRTDKSPYKLWTGATSESQAVGGIGYYLEVSAKGIVTGYGAMLMSPDRLRRYRAAIADERSGAEFEDLINVLAARSLPVSHGAEDPLKTAPRGYAADHPRIHHLRWKGAAVVQEWARADWMHSSEALDVLRSVWLGVEPLKAWFQTHFSMSPRIGNGPP